jgi:peroxiredoxin Q/BCP
MHRLLPTLLCISVASVLALAEEPTKGTPKVEVGAKAPAFQFKDQNGKTVDLADLTAKGPVLVRLTCGCSGCDKELAYFQEIDATYKKAGLTCVAIFKEPDEKIVKYAEEKKITMLYGVDPKGAAWEVFQTKTMPTNFLINKGGEIIAIANGCDPSGLIAKNLSDKISKTLGTEAVDPRKKNEDKK